MRNNLIGRPTLLWVVKCVWSMVCRIKNPLSMMAKSDFISQYKWK